MQQAQYLLIQRLCQRMIVQKDISAQKERRMLHNIHVLLENMETLQRPVSQILTADIFTPVLVI